MGEDMESVPFNPNNVCWPAGNGNPNRKICSGCVACCALNVTDAFKFNELVPFGIVVPFPLLHALVSAASTSMIVLLCDIT